MVLSTGGADLADVERAVEAILPLNEQLCVLQCTAAYPADTDDLNLNVITTLRERFPGLVIGLSDHQNGIAMAVVAYMLGARVIEKHFTLNHAAKGTDHAFSLMPEGMRKLVRDLQRVPGALGDGVKRPLPIEEAPIRKMGKKLVAARELDEGPRSHRGRRCDQVAGRRRPSPVRARPDRGLPPAPAARAGRERRARRPRAGRGTGRGARSSAPVTELSPLLERVRFAVFDFDGVFTDNRVWVNERGEESLAFSRSDGLGLRRLDEVGVRYLIVSMEKNAIVGARAKKLEVDCVQGVDDKLSVVRGRAVDLGVSLEDTAFLGNDINDAECLRAVGVPVVPADAWPEVKPLAHWVLSRPGGSGCVREFCDAVWEAQRA